MDAVAQESVVHYLKGLDQKDWSEALGKIEPEVHEVDRSAMSIWFSFWPLRLCEALEASNDIERTARELELDGNYRLEEQIDSSISFFIGARYWQAVKQALLQHCRTIDDVGGLSLAGRIRNTARQAAAACGAEVSLTLGVMAAAFMTLRQVGFEAIERVADSPARGAASRSPQSALKSRRGKTGLFDFLQGAARSFRLTWDEHDPKAHFEVRQGQDISWAASQVEGDYRALDPRRIEGPIPAQCRSGACGSCWVGVISGRRNVAAVTRFEQRRLWYFGYHQRGSESGSYPQIRLACQCQCSGDVTLVVPPWNGVLDGER